MIVGNCPDRQEKLKKRHIFYGLNIVLPLFFGFLFYLFLRRDAYIAAFFNRYIFVPAFPASVFPEWLVSFFRNFASDILWAYSLCFAVMLILGYCRSNLYGAFVICLSFVGLLEVFQKAGFLHGTFDPLDILLEACSVCFALFIIKNYEEAQNEKNRKSH